ncbi:MAG: UDP-N-acetylmuramate dehydrogenase [Chitinophagaceae bacterium]
MQILENISLRPYNTFGIEARARYFASFKNNDELEELLAPGFQLPALLLGGGSNILLGGDIDGLVLKNDIRGITELHEDHEYVYVKAGAGENWHQFVMYCIERNWAGVENLSLIPGNAGASPMQNIGAYAVELQDVFFDLEAYHIKEKKIVRFTRNDCGFGYRESVFKGKYKDQFVILSVTYQLRKKPIFNTSYGAIEQELEKIGVKELSIKAISEAVIRIRSSKLPDPAQTGNAGSFFKNPLVSKEQFLQLKAMFSTIIGHETHGAVKLAAGWLIEQCGWKGFRRGDAGCHAQQALVLVNYGNASGKEIYELSKEILQSVKEKFGVVLEREVNII